MAYQKGEGVNIGFARETVRGTPESPSIWTPARAPASIRLITEKGNLRETRGTNVASQGSFITSKRVEGELEFNVRNGSIGQLLLSLLGSVSTSTLTTGVYQHIFNILTGNPQYPTLTIGLSQDSQQDYEYERCIANRLELRVAVDDLVNATAGFIGAEENTHAAYTVAMPTDDYHFRQYDATIKIASNVAGLSGASALALKEFNLSIVNNARINQNIGSLNPSDVFAILHEITGSFSIDYDGETYHDLYRDDTVRAMQIELVRSDVDLGSGNYPTIRFVMPEVTLTNLTPDRPIDDIVTENVEFMAHYGETDGYAVRATVINSTANYD